MSTAGCGNDGACAPPMDSTPEGTGNEASGSAEKSAPPKCRAAAGRRKACCEEALRGVKPKICKKWKKAARKMQAEVAAKAAAAAAAAAADPCCCAE